MSTVTDDPWMSQDSKRRRAEVLAARWGDMVRMLGDEIQRAESLPQGVRISPALRNMGMMNIRNLPPSEEIGIYKYLVDVLKSLSATARESARSNSTPALPTTAENPPPDEVKASKGKK